MNRVAPLGVWVGAALLASCGGGGGGSDAGSASAPVSNSTTATSSAQPQTAAGCMDSARFVAGAAKVLNYVSTADNTTSRQTRTEVTSGLTNFQGQQVTESRTVNTVTGTTTVLQSATNFLRASGADILDHGNVITRVLNGTNTTITTAFSPVLVMRFSLRPGESVSQGISQSVSFQPAVAAPTTVQGTVTWRFDGFESVTVPAGTFANACRFTLTAEYPNLPSANTTSVQWLANGSGVQIKSQQGAASWSIESGTVNGVRISP